MVGPFYEVKMLEIVTKITASDADRPFSRHGRVKKKVSTNLEAFSFT